MLLGFSAVAMLVMPGIVWLLAREYQEIPGKYELAVTLSRITFPYLGLVVSGGHTHLLYILKRVPRARVETP